MTVVILKENVKPWEDGTRAKCSDLDINYFNTLTDEQKVTYSAGFEPIGNDKYNFVAKHKN